MSQAGSPTAPDFTAAPLAVQQPKLLDRLRSALEARRFASATIARFVEWNRRYIHFHRLRHPQTMRREHIEQFLTELAQRGYGGAVQAEARRALAFLYREVLRQEIAWPETARLNGQLTPINAHDTALLQSPKLLDRACGLLRVRRYALRTEECYLQWMRRYILFHDKRHPLELGAISVTRNPRPIEAENQKRAGPASAGAVGC